MKTQKKSKTPKIKKTKIINLFAGPGASKSTTAAHLFSMMKQDGISCELTSEFAKILTWESHANVLSDQLYVTAHQNRNQLRLIGKVDFVITDSPLLLGAIYDKKKFKHLSPLIFELFHHYDNYNFFINRLKKYDPNGRNQTEKEAKSIDGKVKKLLTAENCEFDIVQGDKTCAEQIYNILKTKQII